MNKLKESHAEKILANATYLIEFDDSEASLLLRQCHIEILQEISSRSDYSFSWQVRLIAPHDVYQVLNDEEDPITINIKSTFRLVASSESSVIEDFKVLPKLVDPSSNWRDETPKSPPFGEHLLASAVHFLLEGSEEDVEAANLLRQCVLNTHQVMAENFGEVCLSGLEIYLIAPRAAYDILSDESYSIPQIIKSAILSILPRKYQYKYIEKTFHIQGQLVQAKEGWRDELGLEAVGLEPEVSAPHLCWMDVLQSQQLDFIKRLQSDPYSLLVSPIKGCSGELVTIQSSRTKELREFCWAMIDKYNTRSTSKAIFINNLKGKLGEEALSYLLGDYVTEVDYEIKIKGDGKIDFKLTSHPEIGIQVKARNGSFQSVEWSVSPEEIRANKVIVCFLIAEEVSEAQPEYRIISAGFMPTELIETNKIPTNLSIKIDYLFYIGGLKRYLEFLTARSDFEAGRSLSDIDNSLEELWNKVLESVQPYSSRVMLTQLAHLVSFDDDCARISVLSSKISRMVEERTFIIEKAFESIYKRKIKIILEVNESLKKTSK